MHLGGEWHARCAHLRKAWTKQLYAEYDQILFQYKLKLRPPVIRIESLASCWGRWDPVSRSITLSAELIERHAWSIVLEVLKHEMAHQLVNEEWGGDHTHGSSFMRACARLGVAAWAARAQGELPTEIPDWRQGQLTPQEEKLLRRVEKLLSLAQSTNEHEAYLAMQRVNQLYTRYNLLRLRDVSEADMVYLHLGRRCKRVSQAESMIFSILTEHFFVKVVFTSLYDPQDLCEYKVAEIMGTRQNVAMAEYVYHFLGNQTNVLWQRYRQNFGGSIKEKRSYMLGVLSGFRDKLTQGKKESLKAAANDLSVGETRALLILAERELDTFVDHRYPRLQKRSWSSSYRDTGAFKAGLDDGRRLNLHKGIDHKGGQSQLALPSR